MTPEEGHNSTPPEVPKDGPRDGFERLAQAGRVDFHMVKDGHAVTEQDQEHLRGELRDWRRDNARNDGKPYPNTKLAPRVGVSPPVLSDWLNRKYKGDNAGVARLVDDFLARERERLGRHDFRQFAYIQVSSKVFACLDAGRANGTMPVVIAPPGGCKTSHVLAYQRDRSGVVVLRIKDQPCDKRAVTEQMCDVIQELRPMKSRPHRRRLESIEQWLRKRRNAMLIVDEAQKLSASGLELLRDLHDGSDPTGHHCLPIAFFGDESFRKLLGETKDGRTTKLQPQMIRRMVPVFDMVKDGGVDGENSDLYTVEDILKIVRNDRLRLLTRPAARWLRDLANVHGFGLLGFAIAVLRQAALLFKDRLARGGQLDVSDLQESLRMTAGRSLAIEIDQAAGGELLAKVS